MEHVDIVCVYDNDRFAAPIEYTFHLLLSAFDFGYRVTPLRQLVEEGCPRDALFISYASDFLDLGADRQIHIYASDFFGDNYLKPHSLPEGPLKKYDGLPVIYGGSGPFEWVRQSEGLLETNVDIIASSFFMVSRYEEVVQDVKDEHDRFPAAASLAFQEGFLDRPIVNEYIELLWRWVQGLAPSLRRRSLWPQNRDFAVCLTHDVDRFRKYLDASAALAMARAAFSRGHIRSGLRTATDYLGICLDLRKDPLDTFDYMLDLEQRLGFRSSFYFMTGGSSAFDNRYSVEDRGIVNLMRKIEARGCEVGLHPSYDSYSRLELIASEKATLDGVVANRTYGCRQHYLRWSTPDTWRAQETAGLLYDSTLGFADHIGFRCGFCLPFRPFDIMENRTLDIWELPLTVQEGTLRGAPYQNINPEEAYQQSVELIQAARQCHGVFVLLWHNSSFDPSDAWAGWKELYETLMRYVGEQNAWVTSGREIVEWWWQHHRSGTASLRPR